MARFETWLAVVLLLLAALVLGRRGFLRVVIYDYQKGLLYRAGRLVRTLDAGLYWVFRPFAAVQVVDLRSRLSAVPGQEILTADSVALRISLALRYRVVRPEAAVQLVQSLTDALYLEAQLALRDLVAGLAVDELLARRGELAGQVRARLEPTAAVLGVELETVGIKDVTFPAPLKQVFAQVVEARQAAQAAVERARGESAALRHLGNAARMLEGNAALVTMKTLQAISNGRNTIVLGVPGALLPVDRPRTGPASRPGGDEPAGN